MSRTVSPSTNRPYGVALVARIWRVARAGVYRLRAANDDAPTGRRPGPPGPCSDAELVEHIRRQINDSPFHGEGYRKIWARLRFAGIRTSQRRVARLMREHGLSAPHASRPPRTRAHDGNIGTERVDEMWGTDMSETVTVDDGRAYVFVAVDHCSGEVVGAHAAAGASRWEALEPVRQGVRRCFGTFGADVAVGMKLRHDHGSNYMARDFQAEIAFLGIEASPSFVRQPEGNGVAERFFRTLKENFLWIHTFTTIEELRTELLAFVREYNEGWLVARHGYKTPSQVRAEQLAVDQEDATAVALAA